MKTIKNSTLAVPICLVEGDFRALLIMESMKNEGIPVFFNTENHTLYTDSEENAEIGRYLLFSCA